MNLLDATGHLLDFARTNAHESDRVIQQAIKRMEKRYMVLKVRAAKNRARIRRKAFWSAMAAFNGCVVNVHGSNFAAIPCSACDTNILFGHFTKCGEWDGRGIVTQVTCPKCAVVMTPPPHENGVFLVEAK